MHDVAATPEQAVRHLLESGDAYIRMRSFNPNFPNQHVDLLVRNQMWFSGIREQDDIFEGDPHFIWREEPTSLVEVAELTRRNIPDASPDEIRQIAQRLYARIRDPQILDGMRREYQHRMRDLYYQSSIASFFKSVTNQRNWAEYADRGRGYALVFDFRAPWEFEGALGMPPSRWVPFEVRYAGVNQRPSIELAIAPANPEESFREIEAALLTKSDRWADQAEERLIRVGVAPGLVEFPEESLKAVVLGYAISQGDRYQVIQALRQRRRRVVLLEAAVGAGYEIDLRLVDY